MPRHIVEVHTFTHTCPADPQPHAVDTWRALIDTIRTGACTNPQPVHTGDGVVIVDCGTLLPRDRCCPACTVTITIQASFTTHLGPEPVHTSTAARGVLPAPCRVCGMPVAAIFADTGRHPSCIAPRGRR
jgi:hypothetical protein